MVYFLCLQDFISNIMFRGCYFVAVLNLDVKETNVELGSTNKKTKKEITFKAFYASVLFYSVNDSTEK